MERYNEISDFICGSLIMIDYDVEFEKIISDFFVNEKEENIEVFIKEVKDTLLDISSAKKIPMEKILDRSNFDFDEEGLKELCEDILEEYKKI